MTGMGRRLEVEVPVEWLEFGALVGLARKIIEQADIPSRAGLDDEHAIQINDVWVTGLTEREFRVATQKARDDLVKQWNEDRRRTL